MSVLGIKVVLVAGSSVVMEGIEVGRELVAELVNGRRNV